MHKNNLSQKSSNIPQVSGWLIFTFVSKKEAVDLARAKMRQLFDSPGLVTLICQWMDSPGLVTRICQWFDSLGFVTRIRQWFDSPGLVMRIRQWFNSLALTSLEGPSLPRYWRNRVEPGLQMETLDTVNPSTQTRSHCSVELASRVEPANRLEPVNRVELGLPQAGGSWHMW